MNDADSKKQTVERFIKTIYPDMTELAMSVNTEDSCLRDATELIEGLQVKVKEQDREIERLGMQREGMTIAEEVLIQEAIKLVEFKGRTRDFPIVPLCEAVKKVQRERKKR